MCVVGRGKSWEMQHDKQALVLVNKGGATGADVLRLSQTIQEDVYKRFNVEIHPEVNFIG